MLIGANGESLTQFKIRVSAEVAGLSHQPPILSQTTPSLQANYSNTPNSIWLLVITSNTAVREDGQRML